jgi:hypothetical protein
MLCFSTPTPGSGFKAVVDHKCSGQIACIGIYNNDVGIRYCVGSSGMLIGELTVYVKLFLSTIHQLSMLAHQ